MIISRLSSGKWSGASAILVDFDLPDGVDVADIVVVLNNEESLNFVSGQGGMIGKGLTIEPGPIPPTDAPAVQSRTAPRRKDLNFAYAKSTGHLLEVDIKPLIIHEANGENEQFYGVPGISAKEILSGQVRTPSGASDHLYSTLDALDQRAPSLSGLPKPGKCPGDCRVRAPATTAS